MSSKDASGSNENRRGAAGLDDPLTEALVRTRRFFTRAEVSSDLRTLHQIGGRQADDFYRDRWSHDKVVRSTHGVNCTGSCSWKVYVKDGIITWESQQTDYPSVGPDSPEYEPRGCPRGAAFSWYTYSPTRVRYPYVRGVLLEMYREAKARIGDPVLAWADIVDDPERSRRYKRARGKGGLVRATWDEATEIVAAAHVHTIKKFGPDRVAGFSPIPAMSMVSHASGARFVSLIGGSMLSFYDWYADLPVASPQVFGDQTDVPESGDWWDAGYLIMWGSNVPVTRTPDAHWMAEARYRGQKVVAVSPDYADNVKFADEWLAAQPGTDGALAMAMGHVILKEFFVDRQVPLLHRLREEVHRPAVPGPPRASAAAATSPGKFLTASDLAGEQDARARRVQDGAARRGDRPAGRAERLARLPVRRRGRRASGTSTSARSTRCSSAAGGPDAPVRGRAAALRRARRLGRRAAARRAGAPGRRPPGHHRLRPDARAVRRRPATACPAPGRPATTTLTEPYTPAWQEAITGVPAHKAERIGREFAANAEESRGRSMILMGAGTNHWFHSDTIYRAFLALTTLTGCQGVNGGGWAHYVGQEKCRPVTGWAQLAFGLDWSRPPRQMIQTAYWYLHTDQFRYDHVRRRHAVGHDRARASSPGKTTADVIAQSARMGWMPSYPTFDRNPLDLADEAAGVGQDRSATTSSTQLKSGDLRFACEDPDAPENFPRVLTVWRANLLGSSARATSTSSSTCSAPTTSLRATEAPPEAAAAGRRLARRGAGGQARPAAVAGLPDDEHHDLLRRRAAGRHLVREARPQHHRHAPVRPLVQPGDRAAVADPHRLGRLPDDRARRSASSPRRTSASAGTSWRCRCCTTPPTRWRTRTAWCATGRPASASRCRACTMPKLVVVERDYPAVAAKMSALGPLMDTLGATTKGVTYDARPRGRLPAAARTARCAAAPPTGGRRSSRDVRRLRDDPRAVRHHQRAPGDAGLPHPREAHRAADGRPGRRARGQADHLRRHPGPARRRSSPRRSGRAPRPAAGATRRSPSTSSGSSRGTRSPAASTSTSTTTG